VRDDSLPGGGRGRTRDQDVEAVVERAQKFGRVDVRLRAVEDRPPADAVAVHDDIVVLEEGGELGRVRRLGCQHVAARQRVAEASDDRPRVESPTV